MTVLAETAVAGDVAEPDGAGVPASLDPAAAERQALIERWAERHGVDAARRLAEAWPTRTPPEASGRIGTPREFHHILPIGGRAVMTRVVPNGSRQENAVQAHTTGRLVEPVDVRKDEPRRSEGR